MSNYLNVAESRVLAFSVRDRGSSQIRTSRVLLELEIDLLEEVLRRSQTEDDGAIARWLMDHQLRLMGITSGQDARTPETL